MDTRSFIKQLMAIPFLPGPLINPTANFLQVPSIEHSEMLKLEKLKQYFKKRWLTRITPEELSVYELNFATNNAAESYHSKLKSIVKTCHPRIWTFMSILNEVIADTDNDIGRLRQGREISRPRKRKDVKNDSHRLECKQKLKDGIYNPWQYLKSMSNSIGNLRIMTS